MSESLDSVEGVLATEIAPASKPRDSGGKFIRELSNPEPMFSERRIEGDPLTGDTSDGGDDPVFAAREREIADGYEQGRQTTSNRQNLRRPAADESDDDLSDREPENISAESESDSDEGEGSGDEDGSARYEITVDGQKHEVSLNEALNGYIRQATFHQRMAQVTQAQHELEGERAQLQQGWAWWSKAKADYEEDLGNLIPAEPNWDQLFAQDPHGAHATQKIYQNLYAKLAQSQQLRAQREHAAMVEQDRRTQKYAVDGFSQFVMNHIKSMPDEPTLRKNIQSMRRTAAAAGFSEYEVATVYDPRMLDVLWKASKYDRMTAAAPRAVVSGKGRTLAPGAATPLSGNARRSGYDDAQRRLAKSGKISDAAEVFRFITWPEGPMANSTAKVTQAFATYTATGNREDLSNAIYNIDPFDTPVMSASRRRNVKNRWFDWQTEFLPTVNLTNAQPEGFNLATFQDAATPTIRQQGVAQISKRDATVSGSQEEADAAGKGSEMAHQMAVISKVLKSDMEAIMCSRQARVDETSGNAPTARVTESIPHWIGRAADRLGVTGLTKTVSAIGGAVVGVFGAVGTSGLPSSNTGTMTAPGTPLQISEQMVGDAMQLAYTNGASPTLLVVPPGPKRTVSTFTGRSTTQVLVGKTEVVSTVDVISTDFGRIKVIPSRWVPTDIGLLLDPDYVAVAFYRSFRQYLMARTGDAENRLIVVEWGIEMRNALAHVLLNGIKA